MPRKTDQRALQETALRHFLEVAQTGSVTAAAERLHVAPSAVSRSIARLEEALDTLLFERRARGMHLNSAGELLAVHARRAWQDIERVVAEIGSLRGLRSGNVRLASTEGLAAEFLPQLIAGFQRHYPGIRFMLEVCQQADIPRLLRHGDMDIGLTFGTSSERDIQVERRHAAPILAVVSPDHPLANRRQLALAQLAGHALALPPPSSTLRQLFDISCTRQGLSHDAALLCNRLDPAIAFAAAGGGVALCGELAIRSRLQSGAVVGIALRDREMNERHFEVQTLAGRTLPSACRAFLNHLNDLLQQEP
ncbi:LysR family transcriptional regulator [Ideonella livida]|uniref:LysR family transcriptional regulator n=1 Tax=Ideonella livida TaxID=2707176 RepID=A0A7C9PI17_9BURK|nr:LysR family transcriptional regulator [Ideonella livida]NDY92513.1 LysR family transcriptional regulator [Ideonella livida]